MSQQPHSFVQRPCLTTDLRLALSVLYNLQHHHPNAAPTSAIAHEYLLQFQSRNIRRRLHSQFKGQNQTLPQGQNELQQEIPQLTSGDVGSTWLTCIFLISLLADQSTAPGHHQHQNLQSSSVHYAEALFAAQTMVHRLRRVKLAEAVDVEFEAVSSAPNNSIPAVALSSFPPPPSFILELYQTWVSQSYNDGSTLVQLLHAYDLAIENNHASNTTDLEERIKGEISMMLLANVMDRLTKKYKGSGLSQIRPLLVTLSSALALLAARIRYTPMSLPDPVPNSLPIVQMILQSLVSTRQQREKQGGECYNDHSAPDLYYMCLAAIPDALLQHGGGGGAYGRFSLEPRCYTAVTTELKTHGIIHVWQSLQEIEANMPKDTAFTSSPVLLLNMCEAWAKHVPLPNDFVACTVPWVLHCWQHQSGSLEAKAAMGYWIATMESGAWTVEHVLMTSLVQGRQKNQQPNKKRQSSKSKRREQKLLQERTNDNLQELARNEVRHRGQIACMVARSTWTAFLELLQRELHEIATSLATAQLHSEVVAVDDVEGGGPIGALSACATACLPHILRAVSCDHKQDVDLSLFISIAQAVEHACASPSRQVRMFMTESLYTLHQTMTECVTSPCAMDPSGDFLEALTRHFVDSMLNLSKMCLYPEGYFDNLETCNDEDLEVERNDVRDVLRTMAGMPQSKPGSEGNEVSAAVCSSVLLRFLQLCANPMREAASSESLASETVLHAFSALAKPINSAASYYTRRCGSLNGTNECLKRIVQMSLEIASLSGSSILRCFPVVPVNKILPLSRLYSLSMASLSPMLSSLVGDTDFENQVVSVVGIAIEAAGVSLERLPELPSPSTLRSSRFDVRGAMRSPGGEDHVGVLTLLRFASESDALSRVFLASKQRILLELCVLHKELKKMEVSRGVGVFWGVGVLPKSRRILLSIVCNLATIADDAQVSKELMAIFEHSVSSIVRLSGRPTPEAMFFTCESVSDIAALGAWATRALFTAENDSSVESKCLHILHESTNLGFRVLMGDEIDDHTIHQWNRLRAAMFVLLQGAGAPDLTSSAAKLIQSLIRVECNGVLIQCGCGPSSASRLFQEGIISEENVPAGLFIRVLGETLSNASQARVVVSVLQNCLETLIVSREYVLQTMISECSCPNGKDSFHDPRPVITESWLICMNSLCVAVVTQGALRPEVLGQNLTRDVKDVLVDTFIASVALLLYSSLEKTQERRSKDPGMSLDGPQGLVILDFFGLYFSMGHEMLQIAASRLISQIPVETGPNPEAAGFGIVGAALFRGIQGALPPWSVESVPSVYAALFSALGNADDFASMLDVSLSTRLRENERFGGVEGGCLLAGKVLEKINDKGAFLMQAKEVARENSTASWKRLKTIIKQICGGKKKNTDFNQRPALTRWDGLDRV